MADRSAGSFAASQPVAVDADIALLVSDELAKAADVAEQLRASGLVPVVTAAGTAAQLVGKWEPRVAILDPAAAGRSDLAAKLREKHVPVLVVDTREQGDESPMSDSRDLAVAAQVVARSSHWEGRSDREDESALRLDLVERVAFLDGRRLELPPIEFELLSAFVLHPFEPLSAERLRSCGWPANSFATPYDVRRHIYRLRRLLSDHERKPPLIQTRRGFGYVFAPSAAS